MVDEAFKSMNILTVDYIRLIKMDQNNNSIILLLSIYLNLIYKGYRYHCVPIIVVKLKRMTVTVPVIVTLDFSSRLSYT